MSEQELLQKIHSLAEENNQILHRMQRSARWGTFFRFIYWVVIIGSFAGTYYFLQPFLDQGMEIYQQILKQMPRG